LYATDIVIDEHFAMPPNELLLHRSAHGGGHRGDKHQVSGTIHRRVQSVSSSTSIASFEALARFTDALGSALGVGLNVDAGMSGKSSPSLGHLVELVPIEGECLGRH